MRIGFGYDVHPLMKGFDLWIGGIKVPSPTGAVGHSDADVLIHAICDALLGASNLGDIGHHFPDSNPEFKGIDSKILLKKAHDLVRGKGFFIVNIDTTVCLQQPKIGPFLPEMKKILASTLALDEEKISIKATTTEHLGFVGRGEGIAAYAVTLIESNS